MFENYNYYFNQAITKKSNLELLKWIKTLPMIK